MRQAFYIPFLMVENTRCKGKNNTPTVTAVHTVCEIITGMDAEKYTRAAFPDRPYQNAVKKLSVSVKKTVNRQAVTANKISAGRLSFPRLPNPPNTKARRL